MYAIAFAVAILEMLAKIAICSGYITGGLVTFKRVPMPDMLIPEVTNWAENSASNFR